MALNIFRSNRFRILTSASSLNYTRLKYLLGIIFSFLYIACFGISNVTASKLMFETDVVVNYEITESGVAHTTFEISIENLSSNIQADKYKLNLLNVDPENIQAIENDTALNIDKATNTGGSVLTVNFDKKLVGKNKKRSFKITFDDFTRASRTGEVWEITIPKADESSSFRTYDVTLKVPNDFGKPAYVSPDPKRISENVGYQEFRFERDQIVDTGITAGFGKFQVFDFNLLYHLENTSTTSKTFEIAIPPDTSMQRVYYDEIQPEPKSIRLDNDGNWLASFDVNGRNKIDISVLGHVQIFGFLRKSNELSEEERSNNLKADDYWEVDDPTISSLASELKTPENIYNYVVNTLSYNYSKNSADINRLGAVQSLVRPDEAICMEFTDLFIALARSAGIPAREINGYAYTENKEIQPLSLVSDVLHAWPEYWDDTNNVWVPVDPTWGSTSKGIDYFNKLDLRHFAFVIHGTSSETPFPPGSYKLGNNPQKDVYINFGELPEKTNSTLDIKTDKSLYYSLFRGKIPVRIKNLGPKAVYDLNTTILFDEELSKKDRIPYILPFTESEINVDLPFSPLALNTPNIVRVVVGPSTLDIPTFKNIVSIVHLLFILLAVLICTVIIATKAGTFRKLFRHIKKK